MEDLLMVVAQNTPLASDTYVLAVRLRRVSKRFRENLPRLRDYTGVSNICEAACAAGDWLVFYCNAFDVLYHCRYLTHSICNDHVHMLELAFAQGWKPDVGLLMFAKGQSKCLQWLREHLTPRDYLAWQQFTRMSGGMLGVRYSN